MENLKLDRAEMEELTQLLNKVEDIFDDPPCRSLKMFCKLWRNDAFKS